jgi:hypothetical protein
VIGIGGECLDVANAVSNPGVTVQIFHCNGTGAQAWTAGTNGTLVALGKCLDAASPGVGSRVEINNCNGSPSQTWQLLSGAIKNPQSALCLDVRGGSSADYTPLVTATCGSGAGQKWTLST